MEDDRKLVSIRRVAEIVPIKDADKIELVRVDGWQCVVKKGEFTKDSLGVYFEIDSFLPLEDRYAFLKHLRTNADGTRGYKLKTAKFRGALSQGLMLPLVFFPELTDVKEGMDVSDLLNVKKFEMPIPAHLMGTIKGSFPGFVHKTDQERIQNLPEYFSQYKDTEFEVSEKADGTSSTYFIYDNVFSVCSRNLELKETEENTYWKVARELDVEGKLRCRDPVLDIAPQGEIVGEGINGNNLKLKGHHYLVFDIWDIRNGRYFSPLACRSLCTVMGLDHVPVIETNLKVFERYDTVDKLLEFAKGKSLLNPEVEREGLVFKSEEGVSFKVINNDYLLKNDSR